MRMSFFCGPFLKSEKASDGVQTECYLYSFCKRLGLYFAATYRMVPSS